MCRYLSIGACKFLVENTHVGMRDFVSRLRFHVTCTGTMEYGVDGRYYVLRCRLSEGEVPECESCGLVPASGRRYDQLTLQFQQWLVK